MPKKGRFANDVDFLNTVNFDKLLSSAIAMFLLLTISLMWEKNRIIQILIIYNFEMDS
jgi:hypothetical protein